MFFFVYDIQQPERLGDGRGSTKVGHRTNPSQITKIPEWCLRPEILKMEKYPKIKTTCMSYILLILLVEYTFIVKYEKARTKLSENIWIWRGLLPCPLILSYYLASVMMIKNLTNIISSTKEILSANIKIKTPKRKYNERAQFLCILIFPIK